MGGRQSSHEANVSNSCSAEVAERGLIGTLLVDGSLYQLIKDAVAIGDFVIGRHRLIYSCIDSLGKQTLNFGLISVAQELEHLGLLTEVGGMAFLDSLTEGVVTDRRHIEHLAFTVRENGKVMHIRRALESISDASAKGESLPGLRERLTSLVEGIAETDGERPYLQNADGIFWKRHTKNGFVLVPITNFQCRIAAEITTDDGLNEQRTFEVDAVLEGRHFRFATSAAQFSTMHWVPENLGAKAILYPGCGVRDHARVAIQLSSDGISTRRVYGHTGWRKIEDAWVYLHGG